MGRPKGWDRRWRAFRWTFAGSAGGGSPGGSCCVLARGRRRRDDCSVSEPLTEPSPAGDRASSIPAVVGADSRGAFGRLRGLWVSPDPEGPTQGRRAGPALPGAAADARAWDPGRQTPRRAMVNHPHRTQRAPPPGSGAAQLRSRRVVGWQLASHMRTDTRARRAVDAEVQSGGQRTF